MAKKMIRKVLDRLKSSPKTFNWFEDDLSTFKEINTDGRFRNDDIALFACLTDKTETTLFDTHYIYHPAWAARIVRDIAPDVHVDISSTLHFCSQLSAFIPSEFYDYRPAKLDLDNLKTASADLTALHFGSDTIQSLSCMHTLEHIGLGRYGDPIDPGGDLKAINELMRVCARNGSLLVVVPVGIKRIMFNAHRIYNATEFATYFSGWQLEDFSLVTDDGDFIKDAPLEEANHQNYGCGCFWFIKP